MMVSEQNLLVTLVLLASAASEKGGINKGSGRPIDL